MGGCWCCDEDNSSDELLDDYSSPNRNWEPVIQQPRSTRSANNNRNGTNSTRGRNRRRSPAARRNRRRSSQRDTAWHTSQHSAPIHQSINHNSFASASNPNSNTNGSSPSEERHLIVSNLNSEPTWKISTLLHKEHNIGLNAAQQLEKLFNEGNTIPFIARHRKDIIGQMTTEKLRNIKCTYNKLLQLRQDIAKVCADISAMGIMNEGLHSTLMNATSQVTLDEIVSKMSKTSKLILLYNVCCSMRHTRRLLISWLQWSAKNSPYMNRVQTWFCKDSPHLSNLLILFK